MPCPQSRSFCIFAVVAACVLSAAGAPNPDSAYFQLSPFKCPAPSFSLALNMSSPSCYLFLDTIGNWICAKGAVSTYFDGISGQSLWNISFDSNLQPAEALPSGVVLFTDTYTIVAVSATAEGGKILWTFAPLSTSGQFTFGWYNYPSQLLVTATLSSSSGRTYVVSMLDVTTGGVVWTLPLLQLIDVVPSYATRQVFLLTPNTTAGIEILSV